MKGEQDFRGTRVGRRQSWYGLKRHAKSALALRFPHLLLRILARLKPSLRAGGRLPAPAHLAEVIGRVRDASFVMVRPDRCEVAKQLYWGDGRRPAPQDDFAVQLFGRLSETADVMLDVGAYTGIFTLVATKVNPNLQAHAFEIVPEARGLLSENCARNGVLDRTTIHHVGVGEPGGSIVVPTGEGGSAVPSFYSSRLHFESGVSIGLESLDSLTAGIPTGSSTVMKVDVEGTEDDVFAYGQAFLARVKPDILCEILSGVARADRVESLLAPHGYRYFLVRERDLLEMEHLEPDPRFRDWLFTIRWPEELASIGLLVASP